MTVENIILRGVRQNNLKNIDVDLPLHRAIIITGPSGSGKSSLAFETVHAEGQRRYMQSLSTYARQFLEKFKAPLAESILNIPPMVALEQSNPVRNSRATVGTSTEINDYLRLLFEKIGTPFCLKCQIPLVTFTTQDHFERICKTYPKQTILLGFEHDIPKDSSARKVFLEEMLKSGYSRVLISHNPLPLEEILSSKKMPKGPWIFLVDRIKISHSSDSALLTRFAESLKAASQLGKGKGALLCESPEGFKLADFLTSATHCPTCQEISPPKSAFSFSFNSPLGACENCKGFGNTLEVDEHLVVPDVRLSLARGAIDPFTKPSLRHWQKKLLDFCKQEKIDADIAYKDLGAEERKKVFDGGKKFIGVRGVFALLNEEKYKMRIRVFVSRYVSPFECLSCKGSRLNAGALSVRINQRNLAELFEMTLSELKDFFRNLKLSPVQKKISQDIIHQLLRRLDTLTTVGLGYLTLSRQTRTLSGGEYQRILLGTQLSQGLTDTLYVLDEPSIALVS